MEREGGIRGEGDALIFMNCCSFKKGLRGVEVEGERETQIQSDKTQHMAIDLMDQAVDNITRSLGHATNQLFYNWLVNIHPPGHGPDLLSKQLSVFFVR